VTVQLKEINDFASVLETAIPAHDVDIISLAVQTVGRELRELAEQFPDNKDTTVAGGAEQRRLARTVVKELVLIMRRIGITATAGRFDEAAGEYATYGKLTFSAVPLILNAAAPWSLYNPAVHQAHFTALRKLLRTADQMPR